MSDFWAEIVETAKSVIRRRRKKSAIWQSYGSGQKTFDEVGIQGAASLCTRWDSRGMDRPAVATREPKAPPNRAAPSGERAYFLAAPSSISSRRPFEAGGAGIVTSSTPSLKCAFACSGITPCGSGITR
jgi:hypothetical protein